VLARLEAGLGVDEDLKLINDVCKSMAATSFCPLAVGAAPPVISAIAEFKDEFVAAIARNPERAKPQIMKVVYPYK
jgi:NADH-quinone oxidoreductase subunit F